MSSIFVGDSGVPIEGNHRELHQSVMVYCLRWWWVHEYWLYYYALNVFCITYILMYIQNIS